MALARILVDGYSLLHAWTELAPGKPRFSAAAREELIHVLTQYHDMTGTPLTVVFDGSRDTVIQITNTSNSMVHAHCFYVNAAPLCIGAGDCLAGTCSGTCEPQWIEVDFAIWLTKQQPTHWSVGEGRLPPGGFPCDANNSDCDNAGIEIGRVPPVSSVPFAGELRCIEVDQSGAPISGLVSRRTR